MKSFLIHVITALRLPLIIPILLLIEAHPFVALLLFLIGVSTDYFDGLLARMIGGTSVFGATFDALVDKVFVLASLFATRPIFRGIVPDYGDTFWITLFLIMLTLETLIVAARATQKTHHASWHGKMKVILQFTGIACIIFAAVISWPFAFWLGIGTLAIAIVFAMASFAAHMRA